MDEYRPARSEALERFRRGEIDAATYAELTRDDLVEVLTEQVTARREIEAQCKRRWRLLHRTAARPTKPMAASTPRSLGGGRLRGALDEPHSRPT
jgi:hypothetical protein